MRGIEMVPEHTQGGVERWISHGIEPGSFLTAVICNDLRTAMGRADEINRAYLFDIVSFFHNYAPSGCWGSPEAYDAWRRSGGLNGSQTEAA